MTEEHKEKQENNEEQQKEMSFFDHLEEFRAKIIWSLVGLIIGCIIAGVFINQIMDNFLLKPAVSVGLKLQNLRPFGQPFFYFKVILVSGIIISFPFIIYQLWSFIEPGLYTREKRWAKRITFFTTLCFLSGVAFSYFVMIPSMLNFAALFGSDKIANIIDINEYYSFIVMILLAAGILFEMPMVAFILSRFGIISVKTMKRYRRHSIVAILILAAVLTPTPDPISQLIFAAPLFVLYEISIIIAKIGERKYLKG